MSTAADTPNINHAGDVDIPCAMCGYSLRGLQPAGRCPECGTEIILSIRAHRFSRHHLIKYAKPELVLRLAIGSTLATLLCYATLLSPILHPTATTPLWLAESLALTGWTIDVVSIWLLMTPLRPRDRRRSFRCRTCAVLWAIVPLVGMFADRDLPLPVGIVVGIIGVLAVCAGFIAGIDYYHRLGSIASRLRSPWLGSACGSLQVLNPVFLFLLATAVMSHSRFIPEPLNNLFVIPTVQFGPLLMLASAMQGQRLILLLATVVTAAAVTHLLICIRLWRIYAAQACGDAMV